MKIDHFGIYVRDLEAVRRFFQEYFGATSNEMYHNPRKGLRTYFLSFPDGGQLELLQRPQQMPLGESNGCTSVHISISVGSKEVVDDMSRRLAEAGYATLDGPRTTGDGFYEASISGPEGLRLEITV